MAAERFEEKPLITHDSLINEYNSTSSSDVDPCALDVNNGSDDEKNSLTNMKPITLTWSTLNVFTIKSKKTTKIKEFFLCSKNGDKKPLGKHIIRNVSGVARPGELLAIIGSSGSGKTTLLNILTSRFSKRFLVTGLVCANGTPIDSNSLTNQLAYVQQDDLFSGYLTVKEHLLFHARVRMDQNIPFQQRVKRVEEVMVELGISDCQNNLIGNKGSLKGISGGEMKRLSFACEVLTNPALMFCDEPTSGLDSFMSFNVVQLLKKLAQMGKTVVCTIHQPSSEIYTLFDKVLLMAKGRVAFLGTPQDAEDFFISLSLPCPIKYNPADHYMRILAIIPGKEESSVQAVNEICDYFDRSKYGIKIATESAIVKKAEHLYDLHLFNYEHRASPFKASWCTQFRAVLWRSFKSVLKEPLVIKVHAIHITILAVLVGLTYLRQKLDQTGVMNINGAIFIMLQIVCYQSAVAVINVFCNQLPLFCREYRNGMYRIDVYYLCKMISDLPLFIVIPTLFSLIVYYLVGLNPDPQRLLIAIGIFILVVSVANSVGYLISCVSKSVTIAMVISSLVNVPAFWFGGFFLNVNSIPVYFKWLSYLSWVRYANEALLVNQWHNVTNITCSLSESDICFRNGEMVLQMYDFSADHFLTDILALLGLNVLFRVLAYLALLIKISLIDY